MHSNNGGQIVVVHPRLQLCDEVAISVRGLLLPCDRRRGTVKSVEMGGRRTVLVVEDEVAVARLLKLTLRTRGWDVRVASSAEDAMDILADWTPTLVLADVHLPERSGVELARGVKQQPQLAATRVVLVSAYEPPDEHPADGFIAKPFEIDSLVDTLDRLAEA